MKIKELHTALDAIGVLATEQDVIDATNKAYAHPRVVREVRAYENAETCERIRARVRLNRAFAHAVMEALNIGPHHLMSPSISEVLEHCDLILDYVVAEKRRHKAEHEALNREMRVQLAEKIRKHLQRPGMTFDSIGRQARVTPTEVSYMLNNTYDGDFPSMIRVMCVVDEHFAKEMRSLLPQA